MVVKSSRKKGVHKLPLILFGVWLVLELLPGFTPASLSDDLYSKLYFFTEDTASIALALACYFSLSYTSVILKGVSLTAVITTILLFGFNTIMNFGLLPGTSATALTIAVFIIALMLFAVRFLFRSTNATWGKPAVNAIYLIIDKPHSFLGMLGLFWSGIGGGYSVYHNGDCYWFPRSEGKMVKTHDQDWYKGRYMINCGPATPDKLADLESMIGQKWSIFNNCFVAFGKWKRRWV